MLLVTGTVTRWAGTTTVAMAKEAPFATNVPLPQAHDWR